MSQMTIQQAIDAAIRHHQAGQLQQAEAIYRQILAVQPNHSDALHLLGVVAHQVGRNDVAIDLINKALAVSPQNSDALSNLGEAYKGLGKYDDAINCYRRSIAMRPNSAAYYNMANVLKLMDRNAEAVEAYQQAVARQPDYADAYNNMADILRQEGKLQEAAAALQRAIAVRPNYPEGLSNYGNILRELGRHRESIAACRQAMAIAPNIAEAPVNLGIAHCELREFTEAITAFHRAIAIKPNYPEAYLNLGIALKESGRNGDAIVAYRKAIEIKPDYAAAHNNLSNALRDEGKLDEAIATLKRAIELDPNYAHAYGNLGIAYKDAGLLDESIEYMRKSIQLKRDAAMHGSMLLIMQCHSATTRASIAAESRRWNDLYAAPLASEIRPHENDRNPDRRLRIGYVSLDFREHPVGRFLAPFLANHDKAQSEIFAYAHVGKPDRLTEMHRRHVDVWRDILAMKDAQVAEQIRQDRIDILVDLSLHTTQNRLLVFARKPAPVQVTWLGYPGSTGMAAVDYRFTDPYLDPVVEPSVDEAQYAEKTIRLADTFWCYDPLDGRDAAVSALPAEKSGFVTFGCLNNFSKVTPLIIDLWGRVMKQVERSRLILLTGNGAHWQRTLGQLAKHGISADRVENIPYKAHRDYLETYHRIDLGLDSFPYNGHTTSLDSLWMGVPVVTLAGELPVSRAGLSQLSNLKMTELAGRSPEEFVRIAVELARDLPRLAQIRAGLRDRMKNSPLMDSKKHVADIESIYRRIWKSWCAGKSR
jgi:predicted O-linked N-acetylglucosamine transferase (SPINDLY family)